MSEATIAMDISKLPAQARALLDVRYGRVANAANLSSLIFHALDNVNWAGFYFLEGDRLVVGPFQGKPACVEIPLGTGVCGTAAHTGEIQRVDDVHAFEGHIACDSASRSEIVLPLFHGSELIGVLDIDSPLPGRFSQRDQEILEEVAAIFVGALEQSG